MRPHNIITHQPFSNLRVNIAEDKPCHLEILQCLRDRFSYMDNTQNAYMHVMFDLHFPQSMPCPDDNRYLQQFLNGLHVFLRRAQLEHQYIWVWESTRDDGHHYHVCLLVQASSYYPFHTIIEKIKELWGLGFGITDRHGLVWDYTRDINGNPLQYHNNGRIISRDDPNHAQVFNDCFAWSTYLSKCRSKQHHPKNIRVFGASQLPRSNLMIL